MVTQTRTRKRFDACRAGSQFDRSAASQQNSIKSVRGRGLPVGMEAVKIYVELPAFICIVDDDGNFMRKASAALFFKRSLGIVPKVPQRYLPRRSPSAKRSEFTLNAYRNKGAFRAPSFDGFDIARTGRVVEASRSRSSAGR